MSIFARPHYQSEATKFIEKLKEDRPHLDQQQVAGRELLWDKNVDSQIWKEYRAGQVAQKPYVYQTGASESAE